MHLRRILEKLCSPCLRQYDLVITRLADFKPGDWIDWVQLITSVIGILWILYQFNRLRRNAEKELEEYLERHLEQEVRDFQKERANTLPIFDELKSRKGIGPLISRIFAFIERFLFAALKWIPLVPNASNLQYALAALRSGSYDGARRRFEAYGTDLLELAKKYEKQASVKRLEAGNFFLYSGCVATTLGDETASIADFKKVLDVKSDDADARERIGREYMRIGSLQEALQEFQSMRDLASEDPARKARAFRLAANVHKLQSRPGLARKQLKQALEIEMLRNDPAKIGETLELFGDLFRDWDPRYQNAALSYYDRAMQQHRVAGDYTCMSNVERKVWSMTHDERYFETFASRLLNRIAEGLKTIALKLRVPDHTK